MKKYLYLVFLLISFFVLMVANSDVSGINGPVYIALQQWIIFSPVLILSLFFDINLVKRILIFITLSLPSSFIYDMWANYEFAFMAFLGIPLFFGLPAIVIGHYTLRNNESVKFYKTVVTILVLSITAISIAGVFVVTESTSRYNREMQHFYYVCKNINSVSGDCSRFK